MSDAIQLLDCRIRAALQPVRLEACQVHKEQPHRLLVTGCIAQCFVQIWPYPFWPRRAITLTWKPSGGSRLAGESDWSSSKVCVMDRHSSQRPSFSKTPARTPARTQLRCRCHVRRSTPAPRCNPLSLFVAEVLAIIPVHVAKALPARNSWPPDNPVSRGRVGTTPLQAFSGRG